MGWVGAGELRTPVAGALDTGTRDDFLFPLGEAEPEGRAAEESESAPTTERWEMYLINVQCKIYSMLNTTVSYSLLLLPLLLKKVNS